MSQTPRPPGLAASALFSDDSDRPLYGATMGQAFTRFWKKYAVFTGRSSRSEFWWMALIGLIAEIAFTALDLVIADGNLPPALALLGPGGIISLICGLIALVPTVALQTRRLHDTNRSGWWQLLVLIPLVGAIILLVLLVSASDPAGSSYDRPLSTGGHRGPAA
jgi:uncharacterized membrane protein YhaH (DUF805 family)